MNRNTKLIFAMTMIVAACFSSMKAEAEIAVSSSVLEFYSIGTFKLQNHIITVTNVDSDSAQITNALVTTRNSQTGLFTVDFAKNKSLKRGESTQVTIQLNPSTMTSFVDESLLIQTVESRGGVLTSSISYPTKVKAYQGNAPVTMDVSSIDIGSVKEGPNTKSKTITFTNQTPFRLKLMLEDRTSTGFSIPSNVVMNPKNAQMDPFSSVRIAIKFDASGLALGKRTTYLWFVEENGAGIWAIPVSANIVPVGKNTADAPPPSSGRGPISGINDGVPPSLNGSSQIEGAGCTVVGFGDASPFSVTGLLFLGILMFVGISIRPKFTK